MLGEFVLYERVFLNLVADAGVKDERYIVGRDSLLAGAVEKAGDGVANVFDQVKAEVTGKPLE